MSLRFRAFMFNVSVVLAVLATSRPAALGAGGEPLPVPRPTQSVSGEGRISAEERYNQGLDLTNRREWRDAEVAYRDAIRINPKLPEAWNGLGHALKQQRKFEESVKSYHEALRLRPEYAQALEYLGEAYVEMGKRDEAQVVLDRLRKLDAGHAVKLARAMAGGASSW